MKIIKSDATKDDEILDMLFDFAYCFGADEITVENDDDDYAVKGRLSNGEYFYASSPREVHRRFVTVSVGRKYNLGLTSFFHGDSKNVESRVSQFVYNYCARHDTIKQSDLEMFGKIDIASIKGAVDIWL